MLVDLIQVHSEKKADTEDNFAYLNQIQSIAFLQR